MGTIHQLRWDRSRTRSAPEISLRPADLLLFFGALFIAAAADKRPQAGKLALVLNRKVTGRVLTPILPFLS